MIIETRTIISETNPHCQYLSERLIIDSIPQEIKFLPQFLVWKYESRVQGSSKPAKKPYSPVTGKAAASTNSDTWGTLQQAVTAFENGDYDGIGFVLADPYCGIDLDECCDPETGQVEDWAWDIITELDSYTEYSPSGTGIHILTKARLGGSGVNRKIDGHKIEVYDRARFFTLTTNRLEELPINIEERQDQVSDLYEQITSSTSQVPAASERATSVKLNDDEITGRLKAAKNSNKFNTLFSGDWALLGYPSQSEADLALCQMIAYYTNDPGQIDRVFRKSALMRPKWDSNYGSQTVDKALATNKEQYNKRVSHNQGRCSNFQQEVQSSAERVEMISYIFKELGIKGNHNQIWNALFSVANGRLEFDADHYTISQRYESQGTNAIGDSIRRFVTALKAAGVAKSVPKPMGACEGLMEYTPGRRNKRSKFKLNFVYWATRAIAYADEHRHEYKQHWQAKQAAAKVIAGQIPRHEPEQGLAKRKLSAIEEAIKKKSKARKLYIEYLNNLVESGYSIDYIDREVNEFATSLLEHGVKQVLAIQDIYTVGGVNDRSGFSVTK